MRYFEKGEYMFEEVKNLIIGAINLLEEAYGLAECDTAKNIRKVKEELENLLVD